MDRAFRAPEYPEVGEAPLVFLAGPIQGAPLWQEDAIKILAQLNPELWVASPRRLIPVVRSGFKGNKYAEQVDWETHHLRKAAKNGAVVFWLAAKTEDIPGREYAQTTRVELGNWMEVARRKEASLVIGVEEGFSGGRYIKRRVSQDCPWVPICETLEETCAQASSLASQHLSGRTPQPRPPAEIKAPPTSIGIPETHGGAR